MKTKFFFCLFIILQSSIHSFSQILFEGKLEGETNWINVPADQLKYKSNSHTTTYIKNHKQRSESSGGATPYISIVDFDANVRLMLMTMKIGDATMKMATISDAMAPNVESEKIEELQEFKTIAGHNCQKVISTWVVKGKQYKSVGYICKDFKMASILRESGIVIAPIGVEQTMEMDGGSSMVITTTNIIPQPINDNLFDVNIPEGYKVTDTRKNKNNNLSVHTTNDLVATPAVSETKQSTTQNTFEGKTDAELKKMLDAALAKEDYDLAQAIKEETANRLKNNKYAKYTAAELKKMLDEAIAKDDFNTAQEIKIETSRRAGK